MFIKYFLSLFVFFGALLPIEGKVFQGSYEYFMHLVPMKAVIYKGNVAYQYEGSVLSVESGVGSSKKMTIVVTDRNKSVIVIKTIGAHFVEANWKVGDALSILIHQQVWEPVAKILVRNNSLNETDYQVFSGSFNYALADHQVPVSLLEEIQKSDNKQFIKIDGDEYYGPIAGELAEFELELFEVIERDPLTGRSYFFDAFRVVQSIKIEGSIELKVYKGFKMKSFASLYTFLEKWAEGDMLQVYVHRYYPQFIWVINSSTSSAVRFDIVGSGETKFVENHPL